ncbi:MAG: hypothetical protein AAGN66_18450 [Acidobacteriota bacterium]
MPSTEVLRWYYFISRVSRAGSEWFQEYSSSASMTLGQHLDDALNLMRDQEISKGYHLLQECCEGVDRVSESHSEAVSLVLRRWYLSTLAFYYYLVKDFEAASQTLKATVSAIESAIEEAPFLVVLASACCELRLHEARIARYARRWNELHRHVELGRRMVRSDHPLCVVGDQAVRFTDIDRFHQSIIAENAEERHALELLLNREARVNGYESAIRSVEIVPNVVVPYH